MPLHNSRWAGVINTAMASRKISPKRNGGTGKLRMPVFKKPKSTWPSWADNDAPPLCSPPLSWDASYPATGRIPCSGYPVRNVRAMRSTAPQPAVDAHKTTEGLNRRSQVILPGCALETDPLSDEKRGSKSVFTRTEIRPEKPIFAASNFRRNAMNYRSAR